MNALGDLDLILRINLCLTSCLKYYYTWYQSNPYYKYNKIPKRMKVSDSKFPDYTASFDKDSKRFDKIGQWNQLGKNSYTSWYR